MIGPDHYRAAEKILNDVFTRTGDGPDVTDAIAAAQVHATLALASATALGIEPTPEGLELWDDMLMHPLDIDEDDDEDTGRRDPDTDRPCMVCGVVLGEHDEPHAKPVVPQSGASWIPSHEWIGGPR